MPPAVALLAAERLLGGTDCERVREGLLAQPVNAASSAAYVVAGGAVLWRLGSRARGRRPEVVAHATLLGLVGIGSVVYHGPQWPGAKLVHDWPIPVLVGVVVATPLVHRARGLAALPGWTPARGALLGGLLVAAGAAYALGRTGSPLCSPESPVQLHAAWHVLTAASFAVVAEILHAGPGGSDG